MYPLYLRKNLENIYNIMYDHNSTSKEEPQKIECDIISSKYNFEIQKLQMNRRQK
jgi:hypothetical protein